MMSRRSGAITAILGFVLLISLMPRHEAALRGRAPQPWTRDRAIRAAQDFSRRFGVDLDGWKFYVLGERSATRSSLAERFPHSEVLHAMPPLEYRVIAVSPDRTTGVRIDLFENGAPARWSWHTARGGSPVSPRPPEPDALLSLFAGANAGRFQKQAEEPETKGTVKQVWKWAADPAEGISEVLEETWRDGVLREVEVHQETTSTVKRQAGPGGRGLELVLEPFNVLFAVAAFLVGGWIGLTRLFRRRDHLRFVLWLLLPFVVVLAAALLFGLQHDLEAFSEWGDRGIPSGGLHVGEIIQQSLRIAGTLGAGFLLLRGWQITAWSGLLLAGRRKWWSCRTGSETLTGWLAGPALASVTYLVAAAWPGAGPSKAAPPSWLLDAWPLLSRPAAFAEEHLGALCFFGVLAPWLLRGGPMPRARATLAAFGCLCLSYGGDGVLQGNNWASALLAAAVAGLTWLIYRRAGILAVFAALLSADLARAIVLQASNGGWTSLAAGQAAFGWLAVLGAAVLIERRGAPSNVDELVAEMARRNDPPVLAEDRPQRERLLNEFAVAAAVQRGVLPSHAPAVPGYSVAAECRPAREVGGDLYDFLALQDGRWAFCVADVSGKGVPAALYMTLTKGMLAAERTFAPDIRSMALSINRSLYEAGRHRTFVTMAVAAVDPDQHYAEILRAGHNPVLWHQSRTGESRYLQPAGVGLGLAANTTFERSLATETIPLEPGDVVVLYSDGLTEAMDPDQAQFGEDRLAGVVQNSAALDAAGILAAVVGAAERFKRGADPHDDLTILVLKRNPVS